MHNVYEERFREVEKASFVPLVFYASGGQGKAASNFLKRIASLLAEKRKEPFSMVMAHLRCRLGFAHPLSVGCYVSNID